MIERSGVGIPGKRVFSQQLRIGRVREVPHGRFPSAAACRQNKIAFSPGNAERRAGAYRRGHLAVHVQKGESALPLYRDRAKIAVGSESAHPALLVAGHGLVARFGIPDQLHAAVGDIKPNHARVWMQHGVASAYRAIRRILVPLAHPVEFQKRLFGVKVRKGMDAIRPARRQHDFVAVDRPAPERDGTAVHASPARDLLEPCRSGKVVNGKPVQPLRRDKFVPGKATVRDAASARKFTELGESAFRRDLQNVQPRVPERGVCHVPAQTDGARLSRRRRTVHVERRIVGGVRLAEVRRGRRRAFRTRRRGDTLDRRHEQPARRARHVNAPISDGD